MENLTQAARALCAVSAGICIVEAFAGGMKLKRQLRLILDLMLALVITSVFVKGGLSIELPRLNIADLSEYNYSQEQYIAEMKAQSEENIAEVLTSQIQAAGISCEEVLVEVNISDELSISISKVELKAEDFSAAAGIVRSSLGKETVIVNGNC